MSSLDNLLDTQGECELRNLVQQGYSHKYISNQLKAHFPSHVGLSERSVRRYCLAKGIKKISNAELDNRVADLIVRYGHCYGRAMMQGAIRAELRTFSGAVSQRRVSQSLLRVAPIQFQERAQDIIERTNPIPYYAPYFGYKAHMDQNGKLQMFGCTHVVIIDGCSRMICGYSSMEIKNPIVIYKDVFRPCLINYGLWDQLRVDHGQEFTLSIFVQDLVAPYRRKQDRVPWKQTASTDNYVIERFWSELNCRVNYPIKRCMNFLVEENDLPMADPMTKHCVSAITRFLVGDAFKHLVESWNHHRVPGSNGCVPIQNMFQTKNTAVLSNSFIPGIEEAITTYEDLGGTLSRLSTFGRDPLFGIEHSFESRKYVFNQTHSSGQALFSDVVHGRFDNVDQALNQYISLTDSLRDDYFILN